MNSTRFLLSSVLVLGLTNSSFAQRGGSAVHVGGGAFYGGAVHVGGGAFYSGPARSGIRPGYGNWNRPGNGFGNSVFFGGFGFVGLGYGFGNPYVGIYGVGGYGWRGATTSTFAGAGGTPLNVNPLLQVTGNTPGFTTQVLNPPPPQVAAAPPEPAPQPAQGGETGLRIVDLLDGGAKKAGLRNGDVILKVAGVRTKTFDQLRAALIAAGAKAEIEFLDGATGTVGRALVGVDAGKIGVSLAEVPVPTIKDS